MEMGPERFEELVVEALESLPPEVAAAMENVEVVVEDEPPDDLLDDLDDLDDDGELFGLYHGVPLTERDDYTWVLPDRISIYMGPLLRAAESPTEIRYEVRRTVIHEIAHHFGIDEDRLVELGWD